MTAASAASLVLAICCAPLIHWPDRGIRALFSLAHKCFETTSSWHEIFAGYRRSPDSSTPASPRAFRAASVLAGATPAVRFRSTLVVKPAAAASAAVARTQ